MIAKKAAQKLVAEIDEIEVAAIIAESCIGLLRPAGNSAQWVLDEVQKHNPGARNDFQSAARRVMLYLKNQIDRGGIAS